MRERTRPSRYRPKPCPCGCGTTGLCASHKRRLHAIMSGAGGRKARGAYTIHGTRGEEYEREGES